MARLPSICEHLNLPVQAGDDEVLRRMRRTYTADFWRERIAYARQIMPGLTVATDIIVGFPGETDEQFSNTFGLLEDNRLRQSPCGHVFAPPGHALGAVGG